MGNAKQEDILRMLCPWKNQCFNKLLDKTGLDGSGSKTDAS